MGGGALMTPALIFLGVGDAATVRAAIENIFEQGATEFVAIPYSNRDATVEVLQGLL